MRARDWVRDFDTGMGTAPTPAHPRHSSPLRAARAALLAGCVMCTMRGCRVFHEVATSTTCSSLKRGSALKPCGWLCSTTTPAGSSSPSFLARPVGDTAEVWLGLAEVWPRSGRASRRGLREGALGNPLTDGAAVCRPAGSGEAALDRVRVPSRVVAVDEARVLRKAPRQRVGAPTRGGHAPSPSTREQRPSSPASGCGALERDQVWRDPPVRADLLGEVAQRAEQLDADGADACAWKTAPSANLLDVWKAGIPPLFLF